MKSLQQQRGITFWGMLFVLGVLATFLFVLFKLMPPYAEDFKVKSALDSLARQPDVSTMSRSQIIEALSKRFDIDNINSVNLGKDLTVENRGTIKVIAIRYEAVVPMVSNLSALIEFDHTKEVRSSE